MFFYRYSFWDCSHKFSINLFLSSWLDCTVYTVLEIDCFSQLQWRLPLIKFCFSTVFLTFSSHQMYFCISQLYFCIYQLYFCISQLYFCVSQLYFCTYQLYFCTSQMYFSMKAVAHQVTDRSIASQLWEELAMVSFTFS